MGVRACQAYHRPERDSRPDYQVQPAPRSRSDRESEVSQGVEGAAGGYATRSNDPQPCHDDEAWRPRSYGRDDSQGYWSSAQRGGHPESTPTPNQTVGRAHDLPIRQECEGLCYLDSAPTDYRRPERRLLPVFQVC